MNFRMYKVASTEERSLSNENRFPLRKKTQAYKEESFFKAQVNNGRAVKRIVGS